MKKESLYSAIKLAIGLTVLTTLAANAAEPEYTKQSILPFFVEGNYAEFSYAYVDPKIEGTDVAGGVDNPAVNQKIYDMMDDFNIFGATIKIAPSDNTALALIYDEPFGVDTVYSKGSEFNNNMGPKYGAYRGPSRYPELDLTRRGQTQ